MTSGPVPLTVKLAWARRVRGYAWSRDRGCVSDNVIGKLKARGVDGYGWRLWTLTNLACAGLSPGQSCVWGLVPAAVECPTVTR
jgi:hypothetical protein